MPKIKTESPGAAIALSGKQIAQAVADFYNKRAQLETELEKAMLANQLAQQKLHLDTLQFAEQARHNQVLEQVQQQRAANEAVRIASQVLKDKIETEKAELDRTRTAQEIEDQKQAQQVLSTVVRAIENNDMFTATQALQQLPLRYSAEVFAAVPRYMAALHVFSTTQPGQLPPSWAAAMMAGQPPTQLPPAEKAKTVTAEEFGKTYGQLTGTAAAAAAGMGTTNILDTINKLFPQPESTLPRPPKQPEALGDMVEALGLGGVTNKVIFHPPKQRK